MNSPDYSAPRQPSIWKPAIITCGVVAGFVLLMLVGTGFFVASRFHPPVSRATAPKILAKIDAVWARYAFKELGLEMELPGSPQPFPLKMSIFAGIGTRDYSAYRWEGTRGRWHVYSYLYNHPADRASRLRSAIRSLRRSPNAADLKDQHDDRTVAGVPATVGTSDYLWNNRACHFRYCFLEMGNRLVKVQTTYWDSDVKLAEPAWNRVLASIKQSRSLVRVPVN